MCGSAYGCTYNSAVFEVKKEVADQTVYLHSAENVRRSRGIAQPFTLLPTGGEGAHAPGS